MLGRELDHVHHGIRVRYQVGIIRRLPGAAPGQKAYGDYQEPSDDESASDPPPKHLFDRHIDPLALVNLLFQLAILFRQTCRTGDESHLGPICQAGDLDCTIVRAMAIKDCSLSLSLHLIPKVQRPIC